MRKSLTTTALVLVLAVVGFAASACGSSKPAAPAPPTTKATIIQPNGQKIHIVTSLPKPKQPTQSASK